MACSKFHSQNCNFITATDEISAGDLKQELKTRILQGEFLPGTEFVMISGTHHGMNPDGEVFLGKTDAVLTQGFYYGVFNYLAQMEGKVPGTKLWKEMNFERSLITITNAEELDMDTFQTTYQLSEITKEDLKKLADKLIKQTRPMVVIFASCFSYHSEIKDYLASQGVLASLALNRDKGDITQGRIFALDDQQREILKKVRKSLDEGKPQHVFLWGSGGTGKTLLLVEILQMYLAYYKLKNVKTKVLVIVYHHTVSNDCKLVEDLNDKYLNVIKDLVDVKVMTFRQACQGRYLFLIIILQKYSISLLITEWNIDILMPARVGGYYQNTASINMNALLRKINDQSREVEQHLVLSDEISADKSGDNFINCLEGINKLISLMAVNPAAFEMSKEMNVQPPEGENVTAERMVTKHRNAFPIANLLLHYNHNEKMQKNSYKCLSAADDCPLNALTLAQGSIPIWIKQDQSISDLEVLQYVLDNSLKNDPSVALLYSPDKDLTPEIKEFCAKQNWKTCTYWNMTGSEDECIISVVEDAYAVLETFSRAKNKLVIITK